jgi:hypothetical protein|tara:strand:- start:283 stop:483 length:201 start_codon:yes stop_codon:yes gene_type:complete
MYELFVLACLVSNPVQCVILQDLKGPYEKEIECAIRAQQIKEEIIINTPLYYAKRYNCKKFYAKSL